MADFSVENGNANASYNNIFAADIGAGLGNRAFNGVLPANGTASSSFGLVSRHGLRQGVVTMGVVVAGGTFSALSVSIQARQQGGSWVTLASMTNTAGGTVSANIEGFDEFLALKDSSTSSGGSPVLTVDLTFN